jgi:cation diffusion facilitator CzcD-associated flavoprotein CzcO
MTCDVVILGAGPYGLSAGAHLRNIKGLEVRVFGEPMDFWKSHMPEGMLLRSPWAASHLSDPNSALSFDAYSEAKRETVPIPIPLERFVDYGLWFQKQAVPEIDPRKVTRIEPSSDGFRLILNDGEQFQTRRVVIAAGIAPFARRPAAFDGVPSELATHVSYGSNVRRFAGKRVAVIGAGQSALESAALIHEAGGDVEVIIRAQDIHWLGWRARMQKLGPLADVFYSRFDIGPAGISRIVAVPDAVKYFPRTVQDVFRQRALRPAGSRWLIDRFKNIRVTTARFVESAKPFGEKLQLRLNDGSSREVDHAVLGTGYKVDITRYPFLPAEVSQKVAQVNGFPRVGLGFESSVPGLHFLGAPSSWRYGPLMFFVCGTDFAARRLANHLSSAKSRNGSK